MQVHLATFLASSLSGLALLGCLFVILTIHNDVNSFWDELDGEMELFRSSTDEMWQVLMRISAVRAPRRTRSNQYRLPSGGDSRFPASPGHDTPIRPPGTDGPTNANCVCNTGAHNKCHAGPPGPKGLPGVPGPNGLPGIDGVPGHDAQDVTPESQAIGTCFYCAAGPAGSPGPMGRPGGRGMKGPDGQEGRPGKDGHPGHPGEMGAGGVAGKQGPAGNPGEKGLDGRKPIGRPGPKGQRGPMGVQGPVGDNGHNGPTGPIGISGPPGTEGTAGPLGPDGPTGEEGKMGRPGQDAEYCQCPQRKGRLHG